MTLADLKIAAEIVSKQISKRFIWRQSLGRESGRITGAAKGQDRLKESSTS